MTMANETATEPIVCEWDATVQDAVRSALLSRHGGSRGSILRERVVVGVLSAIGLGLMGLFITGALGGGIPPDGPGAAAAFAGLAVGLVGPCLLAYLHFFSVWNAPRTIGMLGPNRIEATPQFLRSTAPDIDATIAWRHIIKVVANRGDVLLFTQPGRAVYIPARALGSEADARTAFAMLTRFQEQAAQSLVPAVQTPADAWPPPPQSPPVALPAVGPEIAEPVVDVGGAISGEALRKLQWSSLLRQSVRPVLYVLGIYGVIVCLTWSRGGLVSMLWMVLFPLLFVFFYVRGIRRLLPGLPQALHIGFATDYRWMRVTGVESISAMRVEKLWSVRASGGDLIIGLGPGAMRLIPGALFGSRDQVWEIAGRMQAVIREAKAKRSAV